MLKRASRREVSCRQVDAWLMAYLKGGLPSRREQAVDEHLAGCDACRHALRDARTLEDQLRLPAAHDYPTLSPQASTRIQTRVYRRMRRSMMTQRVSRLAWGVAAVLVLVLVAVGGYAYWQGWLAVRGLVAQPTAETTKPVVAPDPQAGQTTITFACFEYELSAYEDLAAQFEAANPAIQVQVVSVEEILDTGPDDMAMPENATLRIMSASDAANWLIQPEEARQGLFRDLMPLIEADPTFDPDDFYPGLLATFRWDGGTWGLPVGASPRLVFYDRDALDAAGVPCPVQGWTWDDFEAKARALAQPDGEPGRYGYAANPVRDLLVAYLADHDASIVDPVTTPLVFRLDTPVVAQTVRWYLDLVQVAGAVYHLAPQEGLGQAVNPIDEGQAAMWSEAASYLPRRAGSFNVGVVPFPSDEGGATTPVWVAGRVMSAGTTHPDAAWRWLSFLSRQMPGGISSAPVPVRRSLAAAYLDELDDDVAAAYVYALEHALVQTAALASPGSALQEAVGAIINEGQTVEDALADAQARLVASAGSGESAAKVEVPPVPAPTPTSVETGEQAVTLTFMGGVYEQQTYRKLADAFHELHPDIKVRVRSEPAYDDYIDATKMAQASDCFRWGSGVSARDLPALLNLDPFLDASPDFPRDDYFPALWERCRRDGSTWCLPVDARVGAIRYSETLFDEAGVPYPPRPEQGAAAENWTLDEFLATAQALTRGEGAEQQYGYFVYGTGLSMLWHVVEQHGGSLWDESTTPPRPQLDDPRVIEGVRWYADLTRVQPVRHAGFPWWGWEHYADEWRRGDELVRTGRVAMWSEYLGSPWLDYFDLGPSGLVPYPQDRPGSGYPVYGDAHYISAGTEHPQACWTWLEFLAEHTDAVNGAPARRSQAESAAFRNRVGAEEAGIYLYALEQGDASASGQKDVAGRADIWFYQAYDAVLDGGDAAQALGEAQRKAEAYVACLETKRGLSGDELMLACAREVDPGYPIASWEEAE